jgi:type I restriction enzyme S subunit
MTKLDDLISDLCPDGVEYKELQEVFTIRNGYTPSKDKSEFWENGSIPWFRMEDIRENGQILSDSIQHITPYAVKGNLFPANSVIVATSATIGEHALLTVEALANQRFTFLTRKMPYLNTLDMKYFFYHCDILDEWCKQNTTLGNFNSVDMTKFKKYKIPLPPLPVQQEIVRILDKFTELEAELEAELVARKKQYEYYRDELLTFGDDVEWKTLGEISDISVGQAPKENEFGTYPYINAGTTNSGYLSQYNTEADTITTPSRGQGGIGFVGYQTERFWCGPLCYRIRSKDKNISTHFLYYVMKNNILNIIGLAHMTGVPALNRKELVELLIPIPSLEEQKRVVSILDRFDTLVNDITQGLPAEIAARRKQYEYYRDKLLTFREKSS